MIYVVQAGGHDRPFKVGQSENVEQRVRQHQTSNPEPLTLVATFRGGPPLEEILHRALEPLRIHGEWFRGDLPASEHFLFWAGHQETLMWTREAILGGDREITMTLEDVAGEIRRSAFVVSTDGQTFSMPLLNLEAEAA